MLNPGIASDMAQSLVNDYQQWGCLPRWPVANANTKVMVGDSSDPIIAEAYAFGATNFDTTTALQAVLNGATQTCTIGNYTERPMLSDYMSLGYVPYQQGGSQDQASASETLEYSIDDFAISQFALALGDTTDYTTFSERAQNWQNLYNPITGFIEPRNPDGTFISNYSDRSGIGFKEGDAYQYSWMVPYNLGALFTDMGGNQQVVSRLNKFFKKLNTGPTSPHTWLGNEPSLASRRCYDTAVHDEQHAKYELGKRSV
jgi:predicted alpha-1,2-mannosidase